MVEVMNHRTVTVRADTTIGEAANLLVSSGAVSLPVIDERHRVVGVVSGQDLFRAQAGADGSDGTM